MTARSRTVRQRGTAGADDATAAWPTIAVFVIVAFGLAWAVELPLWITGSGLSSAFATVLVPAMMVTPLVATLTVVLLQRQQGTRAALRQLGVWPLHPLKRTIGFTVLAVLLVPVVVLAGIGLSAALGFVTLDVVHLSGFSAALEAATGGPLPVPVWTIATLQLLSIPLGTAVNSVLAFGEEVGWRGWLLPALLPLGTWPALIITGVLWGAWHAPIILLGYNFDEPNLVGVGLMIIATTLIGVLVGWLRMRSASLWPAVFAHGALNAAGGLVTLFAAQEESVDPILAGPLGVGSWIAFTIVVVVLVLTRQLPHRRSKLGKGGSWSRSAPLAPDRRPAPPGRSPRSAHNRGPGGQ
ncbi:CPBP family intramembrane metalloprotease domain-containing protein [Rathayibacter rathayi]|uniref:CPBP family intramembrane metalloprotease domain-containing protein n=1 Tax=Rathayibacter rathayi TaxID=33887 RepID=A0ABX5AD60_RATRA|nr:CPBP family intramembrane metalloprotease domain-containing protein [Rathayibacter rathayi]PPH76230.1 CPBP family intramembrane metalloprotease domain-containing protein [Rathayibacter rathayi]PPI60673.1 CPBP family intramembrane metalloprotease domain-containing protein [Rathayibacter rathayi]